MQQATSNNPVQAARQWQTAVALIADLLGMVAAIFVLPLLIARLQTLSAVNAALFGGAFILFCIAVYLLKKLAATPETVRPTLPEWTVAKRSQQLFGVLFGVAATLFLAHQLGYLELMLAVDDRVLGAGESSAFFVYAPGAWLGLALIYVLILSSTTPPRFAPGEARTPWLALLGLLGVNGMMLFVAAELTVLLAPLPFLAQGGLLLPSLVLLFLPARLVYEHKQPQRTGLISFIFLLILTTILASVG